MVSILILTFLVLIPIVPAFLLFKALPSTASMEGPWQGLQIKLGGGFAGYVLIFLLLLEYHNVWSPYQVWELHGIAVDEHGDPFNDLTPADIVAWPPGVSVTGPGEFRATFTTSVGSGGQVEFPTITVNHRDYVGQPIHLDPSDSDQLPKDVKITKSFLTNTVHTGRIGLRKLPPYNNNQQPLNATNAQGGGPGD